MFTNYRYRVLKNKRGRFAWRMKDMKLGNKMAGDTGPGYKKKDDCLNCLERTIGPERYKKLLADKLPGYEFVDETPADPEAKPEPSPGPVD